MNSLSYSMKFAVLKNNFLIKDEGHAILLLNKKTLALNKAQRGSTNSKENSNHINRSILSMFRETFIITETEYFVYFCRFL